MGLDELRRTLAAELKAELSQADRLAAPVAEAVADPAPVLGRTVAQHVEALSRLSRDLPQADFQAAVDLAVRSRRVIAFGLGPSGALADYLVTQLARFSLDAWGCTRSGLQCADDLHHLRPGDGVVAFAYGRGYAELEALLPQAERIGLESVLVTDGLAPDLRGRFHTVPPVARSRSDMLSMHTATLGLVEALLVGVAAEHPDEALYSLRRLIDLREALVGSPMDLPTSRTRRRRGGLAPERR